MKAKTSYEKNESKNESTESNQKLGSISPSLRRYGLALRPSAGSVLRHRGGPFYVPRRPEKNHRIRFQIHGGGNLACRALIIRRPLVPSSCENNPPSSSSLCHRHHRHKPAHPSKRDDVVPNPIGNISLKPCTLGQKIRRARECLKHREKIKKLNQGSRKAMDRHPAAPALPCVVSAPPKKGGAHGRARVPISASMSLHSEAAFHMRLPPRLP